MRKLLLAIGIISIISLGCDPTKKITDKDDNDNGKCKKLRLVELDEFSTLYSANYTLNALRQDGGNMEMDIIVNTPFKDATLYWTGEVREIYPPQTSVKLILTKDDSASESDTRINLKHELCFDMSSLKKFGDRVKIYIMDDEEAIDLFF